MANQAINPKSDINNANSQQFHCVLTIKDIPIIPQNIVSLVIREWALDYLPRLHLVIQDDGLLSELHTLEDADKIIVELGRTEHDANMYRGEFMLFDWKVNNFADNRMHFIELTATINIPTLFTPVRCKAYANKTGLDTLIDLGISNGCNVITRNNFSTDDMMTWMQVNEADYQFLKHVTARAYKNDDTIITYFDSKKDLYVTSLNTELDKQEFTHAKYNLVNFTSNDLSTENENVLWYSYYDYVNTNGYLNRINNYGVSITYYDLEQSQEINLQDDSHRLSTHSFKHHDYIQTGHYVSNKNYGFQSSNTHDNFIKAINQNKYLRTNFFGYSMVLNVHASVPVKLMDTVMLAIPDLPYYTPRDTNELLSGRYLVGGIVYIITKGSGFQKHVSLHRNGLNNPTLQTQYNVS